MQQYREAAGASRVLVVGAGGIGCELLKNLAGCSFGDIEVLDVDVIELSNLNRQFLFHPQHIGRPKAQVSVAVFVADAQVAAEVLSAQFPAVRIRGHVGDLSDRRLFPLAFFRRFHLFFSALDNVQARRVLNGLALLLRVPVVECGSAGFLGQATVCVPVRLRSADAV